MSTIGTEAWRPASAMRDFLRGEAAGGVALMLAAAAALLAANLPATGAAYAHALHHVTGPVLAPAIGPMTVHLWINDGLMALFFLLVGLEMKREFVEGRLATPARRRLPFLAAATGMIVPALVYRAVVGDAAGLARGWAIPAATDIAFAVGALALLGRRAPPVLALLLATIAIVDDLGAVAIIALVYTDRISAGALAGAAGVLAGLFVLNRRGVGALSPYMIGFVLLWWLVLRSGVHATVAGVLTAFMVPLAARGASPLHALERRLHPWVAFGVMPLFAFANAGVDLRGAGWAMLSEPLVLGIAAGLFVGKQAGVFAGLWLGVRLRLAMLPEGVSWTQLYGLALIAGIGFTMSLFIGGLAFPGDGARMEQVRLGVLAGSALSALGGLIVLALAKPQPARGEGLTR
ncbi:MAG: Na+/H+ antiporter NhaA [Sphingomonas sp.]